MPVGIVFKTRQRWERIARMESLGVSDADIAMSSGISLAGLATLKQSDEYRKLRIQIASGVLSEMDEDIANANEELRNRLKETVPVALQGLADLVSQKVDQKLRLAAIAEVLDRDGRFIKASRTVQNTQGDVPAYMADKGDTELLDRIIATQQPVLTVSKKTEEGETIQ
jgi:hypothetical protein